MTSPTSKLKPSGISRLVGSTVDLPYIDDLWCSLRKGERAVLNLPTYLGNRNPPSSSSSCSYVTRVSQSVVRARRSIGFSSCNRDCEDNALSYYTTDLEKERERGREDSSHRIICFTFWIVEGVGLIRVASDNLTGSNCAVPSSS